MGGTSAMHILGADGFEWGDLLYLLFFLVFPALSGLGKWLRERSQRVNEDDGEITIIKEPKEAGQRRRTLPRRVARPMPLGPPRSAQPSAPVTRQTAEAMPVKSAPQPQPRPAIRTIEPRAQQPPVQPPAPPVRPAAPVRPSSRPPSVVQREPTSRKRTATKRTRDVSVNRRTAARKKGVKERHVKSRPADKHLVTALDERPQDDEAQTIDEFDAVRHPSIADLRRAIVMNEVLGPPLALRNPSSID